MYPRYLSLSLIVLVVLAGLSAPLASGAPVASPSTENTTVESGPATTMAPQADTELAAVSGADSALYSSQQVRPWGHSAINIGAARQYAKQHGNLSRVDVAIVDSGVNYDHPDLKGQFVWGAGIDDDYVANPQMEYGLAHADDTRGHGTSVAGVVAAKDNNQGIIGIIPEADFYAIRVTNETASYRRWRTEGILTAAKGPDKTWNTSDDAEVIILSRGSRGRSEFYHQKIQKVAKRSVIVAAAGNDGDGDPSTSEIHYPAGYREVIGTAMTDQLDTPVRMSSESPRVDLSAPGKDIQSVNGRYVGTSMATPHAGGAVALMAAVTHPYQDQTLLNGSAEDILQQTAVDVGPPGEDNFTGAGLIDARAAVETAAQRRDQYPPVVMDVPVTDPDGDGVYEDLNGDGRVTLLDVQALYAHYDDPEVQAHPEYFSFIGSDVDLVDVQYFFAEVS